MKDTELRGIVLEKYYEKRRQGWIQWLAADFDEIHNSAGVDFVDILRICDQLGDYGLIDWKPIEASGQLASGVGKINAHGVDVIEGNMDPPISITLHQNVNMHGGALQIGNNNTQNVSIQVSLLREAIEKSDGSDEDKREAKSRLNRFLEHPLVTAIVGGVVSSVTQQAGQ